MDEITTSIPIPVHLEGGGPSNRMCTIRWKIEVISRWQRDHGATPDNPARCAIGFSTDEIGRVSSNADPHQIKTHPLIDLNLSRTDCATIIADAGLPVAPKSSCWFCPYQSVGQWRRRMQQQPDLFAAAVELERKLSDRRVALGRDKAFLTRVGLPLDQAIDDQLALFDDPEEIEQCGGSCWT